MVGGHRQPRDLSRVKRGGRRACGGMGRARSFRVAKDVHSRGGRVDSVGTTTTRVLETLARAAPLAGRSELFITPGFSFQVDLLKLNLHLTEAEKSSEPQTKAHHAALAQIRILENRS